jgi:hypothetical protein
MPNKLKIGTLILGYLCVSCKSNNRQSSDKLATKHFSGEVISQLNDGHIIDAVRGNEIRPSHINQKSAEYKELFFDNGNWADVRFMRYPVQRSGSWSVLNNLLCVEITQTYLDKRNSFCRTIWTNDKRKSLFLNNSPHDSDKIEFIEFSVERIH